jgi:nicotinamide mononucleotide transporter
MYLAARGNIWCWLAGFMGAFLYTFIFIYLKIDSQVLLNIIYMLITVYGWMLWLKPLGKNQTSLFVSLSAKNNIKLMVAVIGLAIVFRYLLASWFSESFPFVESCLFFASLFASLLTMFRVMESWIYWLLINAISVVIYWHTGEIVTIVLFLSGMLLAIYGYYNWRQIYAKDLELSGQKVPKP